VSVGLPLLPGLQKKPGSYTCLTTDVFLWFEIAIDIGHLILVVIVILWAAVSAKQAMELSTCS